jgi:hypothetical protein
MQVSNIEITESNEISNEILVGVAEETSTAIRFTELSFVGGGQIVQW